MPKTRYHITGKGYEGDVVFSERSEDDHWQVRKITEVTYSTLLCESVNGDNDGYNLKVINENLTKELFDECQSRYSLHYVLANYRDNGGWRFLFRSRGLFGCWEIRSNKIVRVANVIDRKTVK